MSVYSPWVSIDYGKAWQNKKAETNTRRLNMKIERLIGILSILLQQEKVTAPFLAEKFEVSRRTINRDIEDLCKAGIPLVTTQGQNGGISIMEGYRVDRTLLTSSEMQAILAGIRSLDSVSGTSKYQQLMDKLSIGDSSVLSSNQHILIDLSSWYKQSLAPKIELIQGAIDRREQVEFDYYAPSGESRRRVEPYTLVFQWASWYLWGYCLEKQSYRLFKLNRMVGLMGTGVCFTVREWRAYDMETNQVFPGKLQILAVFPSSMKWRLIEEYGAGSFTEEEGVLFFRSCFTDRETLFSWLLSFGNQVELLEPKALRKELGKTAEEIAEKYK